MKVKSSWADAFFFKAWESGPVRQLQRQSLGASGLDCRRRPKLVLGSIGAAMAGVGGGSMVAVAGVGDGSMVTGAAVGDGLIAVAMAAEVLGSIAGKPFHRKYLHGPGDRAIFAVQASATPTSFIRSHCAAGR
jgi:hypothetical protein